MTYERFTDRLRQVLQYANQEAHQQHSPRVLAEYLWLGILKEGSGVACMLLQRLGVDVHSLEREFRAAFPVPSPSLTPVVWGRIPHDASASTALGWTVEEAVKFHCNYVGTEHLLLGLVRLGWTQTIEVIFQKYQLTYDRVEAELRKILVESLKDDNGKRHAAAVLEELLTPEERQARTGAPMLITEDVLKQLGAVPDATGEIWTLDTPDHDFTIRKFELTFEGTTTHWEVDGKSHISTVVDLIAVAYDFGWRSAD